VKWSVRNGAAGLMALLIFDADCFSSGSMTATAIRWGDQFLQHIAGSLVVLRGMTCRPIRGENLLRWLPDTQRSSLLLGESCADHRNSGPT